MKIVNLEQFRALPSGTLFLKYEPCVFGDLQAKGDTFGCDFLAENITYWPKCTGSDDFEEQLDLALLTGSSIDLDFDATSRDGCFDDDQLFCVYEKSDVENLQDKLNRCLDSAYK